MWLFGNAETGQAVVLDEPSFDQMELLKADGFELLRDFGDRETLLAYGAEFHYVYPEQCQGCEHYLPVATCQGQRWSDHSSRWVVFRHLKLCEQCQQNDLVYKITRATCRPLQPSSS